MSVVLAIAIILLLFDAQNVLAVSSRRVLRPGTARSDDYTIIVPVYGHRRYFDERDHLAPYRERVLVSLDMAGEGMEALAAELDAEGWRVHRTRVPVPGPPSLILDALESGRVGTTYAFRMDADTCPVDDPAPFVAEMARVGVDYASVCVRVQHPRRLVERVQALEYRMAMRGRRLRPWLSSGACYGGTTGPRPPRRRPPRPSAASPPPRPSYPRRTRWGRRSRPPAPRATAARRPSPWPAPPSPRSRRPSSASS